MSKTYRISFDKGVNVVGDKAIIPEGFSTILDNVDLRSGSPRPFKAPEWQFATPATTSRSWSYRGRWFHSDNWQDHTGEYIGGIERVYTAEEGKYPTKTIGGVTALLGTARPKTALSIAKSSDLSPSGLSATISYSGAGNLPDGERLYRISAKTADGVMPPTAPITVTIADTAHAGASVKLTWGQVPKATGYIVFQGTQTEQYRLAELPPSSLSYDDTGAVTASGDNATQFEQTQPFTYAYSYLRNVNGVFDESGLSPVSQEITAAQGRLITRDFLNDGFFDVTDANGAPTVVTGTGSCPTSLSTYGAVSLSGVAVSYSSSTLMTTFYKVGHGFATDDQGYFTGFADPVYQGQTYDIIAVDANRFAVKNVNIPSDVVAATATTAGSFVVGYTYAITTIGTTDFTLIGATANTVGIIFTATGVGTGTGTATQQGVSNLPASASVEPVKALVTYTSTGVVSDDDMIYLVGSGTGQTVAGFYKAKKLSSTTFMVPLLATAAITFSLVKWAPKNNYYWRWRIYRSEQGIWNLVSEETLDNLTYTDAKPFSALGGTPTSFYSENGQNVDYDRAPIGLQGIESHYGMLFGISGHTVRWTPILQPDAWPETFSLPFGYQPVALASFAQGLIVLCEDAIYRIDGNTATGMSVFKTHAEDGCFAPHSVQKTDKGLMYLSKRGIMLFDGSHAECLTDTRIPGTTLTAPSRLVTPYPFWWMPTIMTRNYADLAGEDGIKGDQYSYTLNNTRTIEGYNKYIKSFYHLGKYYLFYSGPDYEANTTFVVDMQIPGFPITTLGMKALDAHVDEFENAYVLLDNSAPATTVTITSPV
jgi:hypothetical protein